MVTNVIHMSGVCKAFGSHRVIDDLSLAVPEHSIFAFLGNNGEGKSTVIRMITGLLRAILGKIGAIVDAPSLYPNLNAEEFLRIGCIIKDLPATEIARVLELVKLNNTRGRLIAKFSLGMKQRLAIAHALLGAPQLLILDEPTNGLDPEGTLDIRTLLKSLPAVAGTSVFVSSHNLSEIEKMASHVALLRDGRIRFQAPIEDLMAQQTGALAIDVGDIARAQQLLAGAAYQVERTEGGQLRVSGVERHQTDRVHALLVHAGIKLYQSVYHTPSLEQWFLGEHHVS